jgi:hypothetical protein
MRLFVCLTVVVWTACGGGDDGGPAPDLDAGEAASWGANCDPRAGDDGDTIAFLDFEVAGHGLERFEDAPVRLLTHRLDDPGRVYGVAEVTLSEGAFAASWRNGYERYEYQPVIVYVDANRSGACEPDVEPARRFISSAWNPVGDVPLVEDVTVFPLDEPATAAICDDINRCGD